MRSQKILKNILMFGLLLLVFFCGPVFAANKIRIVTTTSTFAAIIKDIARDRADIYFIASPNRDIHFITPTPRDVMKLKRTDVFIHGGLDLEAWRGPLLDAVGRMDLMGPLGEKQIDVSQGVPLLEIPTSLSRMQGDIHAFGNPHYWTDPVNGKIIARNIAEGLARIFPEDADYFRKNNDAFGQKIDQKMKGWEQAIQPAKGAAVVTYHNSWPYFMGRFGFNIIGFLEPKPGIPPTAKHIQEIVQVMKEKNDKVIVKEVFHENRTPQKIAKETGAVVVTLAQEAGEIKGDYFELIEHNLSELMKAFRS